MLYVAFFMYCSKLAKCGITAPTHLPRIAVASSSNPSTERWNAAVTAATSAHVAGKELSWETLPSLRQTVEQLIATGRCVAWFRDANTPGGFARVPIETMQLSSQISPIRNAGRRTADPTKPTDHAMALSSATRTLVLSPARLTYLPGRTPARSAFHLRTAKVALGAFPQSTNPLNFGEAQGLLLTDAEFDLPTALRHGGDPADLDAMLVAFAGTSRASYQPLQERIAQEEAVERIRTRYVEARDPDAGPISQADIDVIVEAALDLGQVPSLKLVHAVTQGRGSPNAVYPKIAEAMGRLSPARRAKPPEVHKGFWDAWQALKGAATETGQRALEEQQQALDAERNQLQEARDAFAQEQAAAANAQEERERHLTTLQQELREAKEANERLQNEAGGLRQAQQAADQQRAQDREDLTKAAQLHAADLEAIAAHELAQKQLSAELASAIDALAKANKAKEAAEKANDDLAAKLAAAQERSEELLVDKDAALAELATARREQEAAVTKASRLDTQLADQTSAVTRLTEQRDRDARQWGAIEERLSAREKECVALRPLTGQLQEARQHIARLEGEIAALRQTPPQQTPSTTTKRKRTRGDKP